MEERKQGRWPFDKITRKCNLGDCPAFHLPDAEVDAHIESLKVVSVRKTLSTGVCLVANKSVVIGSKCTVEDNAFEEYMLKPKSE